MKKIILGLSMATLILTGCSGASTKTSGNTDVAWRYIKDLPVPKGYEVQKGVAVTM